MKILIVDDSRVARSSLKKALAGLMNIEFVEANDGKTAIPAVEKEAPDIIFTDWYMEEMDGLELIKIIRASNNSVKICMVTSEANAERKKLALSEGADYIICKPIQFNELAKALEHLVD